MGFLFPTVELEVTLMTDLCGDNVLRAFLPALNYGAKTIFVNTVLWVILCCDNSI